MTIREHKNDKSEGQFEYTNIEVKLDEKYADLKEKGKKQQECGKDDVFVEECGSSSVLSYE